MNRIIYTDNDGNMAIEVPSPEFLKQHGDDAINLLLEIVSNRGIADYDVVDSSSIPMDRTFRGAWKKSGSLIEVDMVKAKNISHSIRRKIRDELMTPLDIQATIPNQAAEAEQARQAIREEDAQKQIAIDNATTPEELKTILGL